MHSLAIPSPCRPRFPQIYFFNGQMTFTSFWPGRILDRAGSGRTGGSLVPTLAVAAAANSRFLRRFRRYRGSKGRRNDKGLGEGETFMAVKDEDPEAESEVVDECITIMAGAEGVWDCYAVGRQPE